MVQRTILGNHPTGGMGLFISKPGVDVAGVDTNRTEGLMFSSNWGQVANIIASGTVGPESPAYIPDQGFIPLIRWEAYTGQSVDVMPTIQFQFKSGDNFVVRTLTRWKLVYYTGGEFRIMRQRPDIDDFSSPFGYDGFRYIVFNIPVDRFY